MATTQRKGFAKIEQPEKPKTKWTPPQIFKPTGEIFEAEILVNPIWATEDMIGKIFDVVQTAENFFVFVDFQDNMRTGETRGILKDHIKIL